MAALTGEAKQDKIETLAQNQGDALLLKQTKAALLTLRLSDKMPLAASSGLSALTGTFIFRAEERYSKADGHWRSCGKPGFFKTLPELGRDCAAPSAISDSKFQSVAAVDGTAQRGSDG